MSTLQQAESPALDQMRSDRLRNTRVFRDGGYDSWLKACLTIIGAGMLGERFATEAVLSGTTVHVYDFDKTEGHNLGTQRGTIGLPKVETLVARCDAIYPQHSVAYAMDIRHAGIGVLAESKLLVDCSDDPALELYLTSVSNGLGIPKLRLAVDGSGTLEMGRISCSHGGGNHSCTMCQYSLADISRKTHRTACPGQRPTPASTFAGGALASSIAGIGLLQAQRLVTGNDLEQVLSRQLVLDLAHAQLLDLKTPRSVNCLSSHLRWELTQLEHQANSLTWGELMEESQRRLGESDVTLEPFGHGLCTTAFCHCGEDLAIVGTRWSAPPRCVSCGASMQWLTEKLITRLNTRTLEALGMRDRTLAGVGLPERGAMVVARTAMKPPLRLVLA